MANVNISDLSAGSALGGTERFEAEQPAGAANVYITANQIKTFATPAGAKLTAANDTNVTLTATGASDTALVNAATVTAGWTGTLAAARINASVPHTITNDTNITGTIAAQVLTLGFTGTLAAARVNASVPHTVTNDTNVTGSIATQILTLGWTGSLAPSRGGTGTQYFNVAGPTSSRTYTFPDASVNVGYLEIPQVPISTVYTTVLTDAGKHIFHPSADTSARVWTIASNGAVAYPIGTAITFVNQTAAGTLSIAITGDTMRLAGSGLGTTGSRTLVANGIATALKVTATEWLISGTGLT